MASVDIFGFGVPSKIFGWYTDACGSVDRRLDTRNYWITKSYPLYPFTKSLTIFFFWLKRERTWNICMEAKRVVYGGKVIKIYRCHERGEIYAMVRLTF